MIRNFLYVVFIVSSFIIVYTFHYNLENNEKNSRNQELEATHKRVLERFDASLDRFASIMSGVRSKILEENFPTQQELHTFLINELDALNFKDSLIVSYLDKNHKFIYSFDTKKINPSNLIGKTVHEFRNSTEVTRLNNLLQSNKLKLFPPINLYEGWVGIPLNFSVIRNNESAGYIASIVNFKNILEPIYKVESQKFFFKFSVKNWASFDREVVHDNSKVYHDRKDPEYYGNFNIDKENFIETEYEKFGLKFIIATAYKEKFVTDPSLAWMFAFWIFFLILAWGSSIYNAKKTDEINKKLRNQNLTIKKQSNELANKNKDLKDYAHVVSHDLKAPLRNINSLMFWLNDEDNIVKNKDSEKYLNHIDANLLRMENLITGILKYSELDNSNIKNESIDIQKVIDTLIEEYSITEEKKINVIIKKELPLFVAEKTKIEQLFQNLFSNAIKYNNKKTCIIEIDYEILENGYKFSFKDNGIGIEKKYYKKIFETFEKLNFNSKNSGIGLAIVERIVHHYNGQIWVTSIFGKETTFYFTLIEEQINED